MCVNDGETHICRYYIHSFFRELIPKHQVHVLSEEIQLIKQAVKNE